MDNVQAVSIPAMDIANSTGPSLDTYLEARFRLLDDKHSVYHQLIESKFTAGTQERWAIRDLLHTRINQVEAHFKEVHDLTQRAMDKAEDAQQAHNHAANEWRGTLNDFRFTLVQRPEFDRLTADFAAYRLETASLMAAMTASKTAVKDVQDDGIAKWTVGASIVATLVAIIALIMSRGGVH